MQPEEVQTILDLTANAQKNAITHITCKEGVCIDVLKAQQIKKNKLFIFKGEREGRKWL